MLRTITLFLLVVNASCASGLGVISNTATSGPLPSDIPVNHKSLELRDDSHWPQSESKIIRWPMNEAETNNHQENSNNIYEQHEGSRRSKLDARFSQREQLNILLNCKSFGHFMELLKEAQQDLLSYLPANLHGSKRSYIHKRRARLWVRKLYEKIRSVFRSCLPLTSLKNILNVHLDDIITSGGYQGEGDEGKSLKSPGSVSANERTGAAASATHQDADNNFPVRFTRRRTPARNSLRKTFETRDYRRKVASLGNNLLRMVSSKNEIDIAIVLQKLIALNEVEGLRSSPQHDNEKGGNVNMKIEGLLKEVPTYFLSVALGPRIVHHGVLAEIASSTRFLNLARGLSPAVLRVGGSAANFVTYSPTNLPNLSSPTDNNQGTNDHNEESFTNKNVKVLHHSRGKYRYLESESELSVVSQGTKQILEGGKFSVAEGGKDVQELSDADTKILIQTPSESEILQTDSRELGHDHEGRHVDHIHDASRETQRRPQFHSGDATKEGDSISILDDAANSAIDEPSHTKSNNGCIFDFKWHSHYKTKPQNDSSYNLLSAMGLGGHVTHEYMQDQQSAVYGSSCDTFGKADLENFTLTADDWATLTDLAKDVGMKLLFDINQFYRTPEGNWDPSNARMIFLDSLAREDNVLWQLGNEPNSYGHKYTFNITGKKDALDFNQLHEELTKYFQDPAIVGPDVTRPHHHPAANANSEKPADGYTESIVFLEDFLSNLDVNLTALSWHQYYIDGHTSTLEDFMSVEVLNQLSWQIPQVVEIRDRLAPNTPVWLTETSSAWGGGAPDLSNSYVAGFLWLDKLGMAAATGIDVVTRQTLYQGCYALIDRDFNPYPDYWLSLLFKELVGEKVLNITLQDITPTSKEVQLTTTRLYAHCQKDSSLSYEPGNVVIYGMNLGNNTITVKLQDIKSHHIIEQYLLEPPQGDLQSRDVLLNGEILQMTSEEELPELKPLLLPQQEFQIPPSTFGYWVIIHSYVAECM